MAKKIATILSLKDKISSPLKKVNKNVNLTAKEMKKVERETKKAQNQIKKWKNNAVKNMNSVIKTTAKVGTAFGVMTAGLAIKSGFGEAMDMEGYKTQLITAVKDTKKAGKLMSDAVKFANKTPFETGQVVEATATMEMYGLSSKRWLADIADMAGATNKDINQATEAMVDATVGEWERLKEFGIRKDQVMLESAKKYGEGVVFNAKGQMLDQAKAMDVLQGMMQEKYKGGAEKLANTSKGLWSTITGVTKSSLAKIVGMQEDGTIKQGSMMEKLKEKIKSVADTLQKWQQDGTMDKIAENITKGATKATEFLGKLKDGVMLVKDNLNILIPVVVGTTTAIGAFKVISGIMKLYEAWKLATQKQTTMQLLLNSALLSNPLTWVALAIGAVIAAGVALYMNWDVVKAKAIELWQRISEAWSNLVAITTDKWNSIKQSVLESVEGLKQGWNEGLENIKEKLSSAVSWIREKWQGVKDFFANPIKGAVSIVKNTISKATGGDEKEEFARGGIARKASIFGEAGPEMAIPLKRGNPRSQMLLEKTDRMINGNSGSGKGSNSVNVSVTVQGNVIGNKQFANEVGNEVYKKVKLALDNI